MGATIDDLQIRLQGDSKSANKEIDTVIKNLQNLSTALGGFKSVPGLQSVTKAFNEMKTATNGIDAGKIKSISSSIRSLASSIVSLQSVSSKGFGLNRLREDIKGLESIKFDASGLSGITNLANSISKIGSKTGTTATANLIPLADNLKRFVTEMNGVQSLAFDAESLSRLASSISKIGGIKVTNATTTLPQLTNSLKKFVTEMNKVEGVSFNTEGLSNLANSISRLGSKTSTVAVNNIPRLTEEIKKLLTTLSQVPSISDNVVRSLEAMAQIANNAGNSVSSATNSISSSSGNSVLGVIGNFSSAFSKVGMVVNVVGKIGSTFVGITKKIANGIKSILPVSNGASKGLKGIAQKIGALYASSFLVVRGFSHLKSAISSAMDYVEEYDYFKNTFNEIAKNADLSKWKELGYKSAETYAQSFRERAEKVTSLMTGYSVDENGALFETGEKNLGLNPTQMMHTQALFGQMSNSMGVATETASKLSRVYTKLGADMASAFNMDFAQVYENLQSGMTGMSRAVDKYGVNIRNAAMQEELHRLGIDASITKLSQQDKVLLRTIITLNSTKQAWGNLASTISSPSNQIRLLSQNFEMLSQMLGSLFLPIVSKVLPYINALVIAFKSLVSYVGGLLGVDLSEFMKGISAGGDNEALSAAYDDADNFADSLDNAGDSAEKAAKKQKKFNKQLQGFDELNNLSTSESEKNPKGSSASSSGTPNVGADLTAALDDAIKEYEKSWQKAFDGMENDANNIAEKIKKAFVKAWKTGDGSEIGEKFAEFINKGLDWVDKRQKKFNNALKKIANILGTGLNGFIRKLKWEKLGKVIGNGIKGVNDAITHFFDVVHWEKLGKKLAKAIKGLVDTGVIESFFRKKGAELRAIIQTAFGFSEEIDLEDIGIHFGEGINEFIGKMNKVKDGLNGWQEAGKTITNFLVKPLKGLSAAIKKIHWDEIGKGITDFLTSIEYEDIADAFSELIETIQDAFGELLDNIGFEDIAEKVSKGVVGFISSYPRLLIGGLNDERKILTSGIRTLFGAISGVVKKRLSTFPKETAGFIEKIFQYLSGSVKDDKLIISGVIKLASNVARSFYGKLPDSFKKKFKSAWKKITNWWSKKSKLPDVIANLIAVAKEKVKGAIDKLKDKWISIKNKTASLVATAKEKVAGALSSLKSGWDSVKSKAVSLIATAKEKTKGALSNLKSAWESIKNKSASLVAEAKEKVKGKLESLGIYWDSVKSKTATLTANVVDKASSVLDGIKSNWSNLKDGVINIGVNISTKAKDIKEKVQSIVKQLGDKTVTLKAKISSKAKDIQDSWSAFKKTVGNKALTFKANIASKASDIQTAFNNFKDGLKNKVISLGVTLAANAENAKEAVQTLASNLAGKIVDLKVKLSTKVSEIWGEFKKGASSLWEKTVTFGAKIGTSAGNIWDNFKKNASSLWNKVVSFGAGINLPSVADIKSSIKEKWNSAISKLKGFKIPINFSFTVSAMKSVINTAIGWINKYIIGALNKISIKIPKIEVLGKKIFSGKTIGFNIKNISKFAQGGFPKTGELFIANEAGPELIGRMNNKNAVANQSDIADGISDAVFNALNPLMTRMANAIVGLEQSMNNANSGNTLSVEGVSDGDIVRIVKNEDTAYRRRTGRSIFA